ncbi:MAG: hypothetical protein WC856_02490 [Methylococcaceae bacterium]|jgi:hypothetical protein
MNSMTDLMRTALTRKEVKKQVPILDAVNDETVSRGSSYTETDIKIKTAAAIQEWVETDDLDSGETLADRLVALIVGIADANKDGEITDDEGVVLDIALNAAWDYLTEKGIDDEDAGALLNDWDADAADRIRDFVASELPDGEEASAADIDNFAFGDSDQEAPLDDAALDAVYRKKVVIKGGKKIRVNKRISGHVRLSAKQKISIRKMHIKSHSAAAQMHRLKSMKIRKRMGVK